MAAEITGIARNSIAEEMGIEKGDVLLSINDHQITDILDYQFYSQDDVLVMEIKKTNNEIWSIEIEKDYDEFLGLEFDEIIFDKMKVCRNHCIFCFVDQMPCRMRKTLYIKDDDYRYSFMYGNFITLTNLNETDWEKIVTMKLSPLYVSVHCIQPELRQMMLNNPRAGTIKKDLQRLHDAGIKVHTQIVLCPGINDGLILKETINSLASFYPSVISIGIVPVGLTAFRDQLPSLRQVSAGQASEIIDTVNIYQGRFRSRYGTGLVYAADEFYIKAGINVPAANYYDDYPQSENGIGLARIFLDDFAPIKLPKYIEPREIYIVTGVSAQPIMEKIISRLNQIKGLNAALIPVPNKFFSGGVTVTGLLTGSDIIAALGLKYAGKQVIIPEVVFKEGQDVLLDGISLDRIRQESQARIVVVDGTAQDLIKKILE